MAARFVADYGLPGTTPQLTQSKAIAAYFEATAKGLQASQAGQQLDHGGVARLNTEDRAIEAALLTRSWLP